MTGSSSAYLDSCLAPLACFLAQPDVTDLYVNRPGEVWTEHLGGAIARHAVDDLDDTALWRLARAIAAASSQGVSRVHPLLSANLPGGARVQIVAPPATRGAMAIAIRRMAISDLSLTDFVPPAAAAGIGAHRRRRAEEDQALRDRLHAGDVAGTLAAAVATRRNILVSGGTGTGKTTFLNTLIRSIPAHERLVLIEDTPELQMRHDNAVGLVGVRDGLGEAVSVGSVELLEASLRLRPDRIILGELRGDEAFAFLRAVNTGHPGSMTTIHADTPEGAVEQIALILGRSVGYRRVEVLDYIGQVVDVFVQVSRDGGKRFVSDIRFADMIDTLMEGRRHRPAPRRSTGPVAATGRHAARSSSPPPR